MDTEYRVEAQATSQSILLPHRSAIHFGARLQKPGVRRITNEDSTCTLYIQSRSVDMYGGLK